MFGTISHLRPKPGKEQALLDHLKEWDRIRRPQVKGALFGYLYRSEKNPGEYVMTVAFKDRESYFANANDPEQDKWYRRLCEMLETEPTWEDGEIIGSFGATREAGR